MFTGIVEEVGEVVAATPVLRLRGPLVVADTRPGDSIAVNGVCLTVVDVDGDSFTADVMAETLHRSSLGTLRTGDPVDLERAVTPRTRLGGHLVQGHVDGVGTLLSREPGDQWATLRFSLPAQLSRYVVEKGSIAVDGVSLTVVAVSPPDATEDGWFAVSLIPTTLDRTVLGRKPVGAPANLEVDMIAKYVERLHGVGS